jgi:methanogenic corrinoid protein MtbC1
VPDTQESAASVGAPGYAADAATAVRKAKELLAARRAAVGVA